MLHLTINHQKERALTDQELYARAVELATEAHKEDTRWDGSPYITHPLAVAETLQGLAKVVGVLHDVVEDTPTTLGDLGRAGMPRKVVSAVAAMTHPENTSYAVYLQRLKENDIARKVKTADILHNLSDLNRKKNKQRFDKYLLALRILNPRSLNDLSIEELKQQANKPVFSLNTGRRGKVVRITGDSSEGWGDPDVWIDWVPKEESLVWHSQSECIILIED